MTTSNITIKGAREHNLRSVNLTIPRGQLVCFTGVSGSGKSSLAFDTLYAEGQRRYVESLSNYARQFMGQMPKPEVDFISGLSPSISISQKSTGTNPRSTVGTITEIYDFLRVLFARVGTGHCSTCGSEITAQTRQQILGRISQLDPQADLLIAAPLVRAQKGEFRDLFEDLRKQGFLRARVDNQIFRLDDPPQLDRNRRHDVDVVIDRLTPSSRSRGRIAEAIETALRMGQGTMLVSLSPSADSANATTTTNNSQDILYSSQYACAACGQSFPPPSPQLFSFNSPQGMCPDCDGLGRLYTFVPELLIPNPKLSFKQGAIQLLGKWTELGRHKKIVYSSVAETVEQVWQLPAGSMLTTPWRDLPVEVQHAWLWGTGDLHITFTWNRGRSSTKYGGTFSGVIAELIERYRAAKNRMYLRAMEKYMDTLDCPGCQGARLNPQARAVTLETAHPAFQLQPKHSLPQLCELPASQLAAFFTELRLSDAASFIATEVLKEIRTRIGFLLGVGLDYLTLARTAPTLSGGESQRIRLAGQIGSGLAGVLYVLDEPSIGLHPRDNDQLIETLLTLRDRGNTLVVVEHDEDTMRAADTIVDFGPGPGVRGGRIVAAGSLDDIAQASKSVTGQFISGKQSIEIPTTRRSTNGNQLQIIGAAHNNLKNINVDIPLGTLTCVTGVSGSGKSSLIGDILEPALRRLLNGAECEAGKHDRLEGLEQLDKTIAIDQSPIGRTPRSNPATYVKVFDEIRNLFVQLPEAKTRGYAPGRFSFNVDGGRCSACDGNGSNKLEMDFLADVWVTCPVCEGSRYNRETLSVKFKEHSIADVLNLDVAEAYKLFRNIPKIAERLSTLIDVGLEYLKLGQPSPTLSGGEAQRIKLSRELSKKSTGCTLYVLDEPTTGLHFADIKLLLKVLHDLVDKGNTVVVVEHNLDVIKTADWVIDLGPEGGAGGGEIVIAGSPEQVAKTSNSHTGQALRRVLDPKSNKTKPNSKKTTAPKSKVSKSTAQSNNDQQIIVRGAAQHNLKHVDVTLPRNAMTVFCGPSGSGKSSLAMDTIYAEGQRRYVESLSAYARQFIGQMQKPAAEQIEGLSPAVALEQKNLGHSPRSTVGTVTEIYDYLRVLMARLGQMHCPDCQIPVGTQTVDQIVDRILRLEPGTKFLLLAPLELEDTDDWNAYWERLRQQGYARVRIDGTTFALDAAPKLSKKQHHRLQLVIDRLTLQASDRTRITESVELALQLGRGVVQLALADGQRPECDWEQQTHSQHLACECCGRSFQPLTPHHFSFNTPLGSCRQCEGLGVQTGTNPQALLKNSRLSLAEGALALWPSLRQRVAAAMLVALARHARLPLDIPFDELSVLQRRVIFHGIGEQWIEVRPDDYQAAEKTILNLDVNQPPQPPQPQQKQQQSRPQPFEASDLGFRFQFKGLYPAIEEASRLSYALRTRLAQFTDRIPCTACDGTRLNDVGCAVRFQGSTIGDLVSMPLARLNQTVKEWTLAPAQRKVAGELIREIRQRVQFLIDVGLDYLTLAREAATLSGGEGQRIRLAAQLGSGLCGVLYVLDEPTVGLHPRDNARLLNALHRLRDLGNTLVVVEHDYDVIRGSDHLCDFGPRAGRLGGQVVASGPPTKLTPAQDSVTGPYITGQRAIPIPTNRRLRDETEIAGAITVVGARENNLQGIDVRIPLGVFTAITGPSGSGKSTLINGILYPALAKLFHHNFSARPGRHQAIETQGKVVDKVIRVDQSPLGNTPASTPATYTGVFDLIRTLFGKLPEARQRGFTSRQFSFNVPGGRCEACEGSGQNRIEMHFLPDVWVQCEACQGKRYTENTLAIRFHGHSIADVLSLSCGEALQLFSAQPKIARILQMLCDVGLDYVTLGQSAPTLSGGEAQRVKLATELARPDTGNTLYLLDEPTTGLHFDDIRKLLDVLQRLVDLGNSVVVIEHNLDVIKTVDWVIDMGPEAGAHGGTVVCEGTPEQVVDYARKAKQTSRRKNSRKQAVDLSCSYTGEALEPVLSRGSYEPRISINRDDYLRQQLKDSRSAIPVPSEVKAAWEVDGRKWHLETILDRTGDPVLWETDCARCLIEMIETTGRFEKFDFNHYSRIEVTGVTSKDANKFAKEHYFLHAFTRERLWLKAKFRIPLRVFRKPDFLQKYQLPTLNSLGIPGVYSGEDRVRVDTNKGFQEIEFRFFKLDEVNNELFRSFLRIAVAVYCDHLTLDEIVIAPPKMLGQSGTQTDSRQTVAESRATTNIHPWQVLGRRWHSLPKGFPQDVAPQWPLQLAEDTLTLFAQVAGNDSLLFESANHVTVRPPTGNDIWVQVETKRPDAIRVVMDGPADAVDAKLLRKVRKRKDLDIKTEKTGRLVLELADAAPLQDDSLIALVNQHFQKTVTAK